MPKKTAKKPKFNNDPLGELSNKVKEIKPQKDTKPIVDYVLDKLGTPNNLVKVEAYHYDWGEGRDNRWRVNIVTEEMLKTDLGNLIPTWKRNHCYFLRFDDDMGVATYCNPPIERAYDSEGELIDGTV